MGSSLREAQAYLEKAQRETDHAKDHDQLVKSGRGTEKANGKAADEHKRLAKEALKKAEAAAKKSQKEKSKKSKMKR